MQITNHESDFDRRVLAAYVLTAVAVLSVAIRADLFANFATTVGQASEGFGSAGYSWIDKLAYVTRGSEFLGLTLLGAAYLLMLDSDDEPKAMKTAIWVTALMSLLLAVSAVLCIADAVLSNTVFLNAGASSRLQAILDFLAGGVLAFSALALTWPVISDISRSDSATPPDVDAGAAADVDATPVDPAPGDVESGED